MRRYRMIPEGVCWKREMMRYSWAPIWRHIFPPSVADYHSLQCVRDLDYIFIRAMWILEMLSTGSVDFRIWKLSSLMVELLRCMTGSCCLVFPGCPTWTSKIEGGSGRGTNVAKVSQWSARPWCQSVVCGHWNGLRGTASEFIGSKQGGQLWARFWPWGNGWQCPSWRVGCFWPENWCISSVIMGNLYTGLIVRSRASSSSA